MFYNIFNKRSNKSLVIDTIRFDEKKCCSKALADISLKDFSLNDISIQLTLNEKMCFYQYDYKELNRRLDNLKAHIIDMEFGATDINLETYKLNSLFLFLKHNPLLFDNKITFNNQEELALKKILHIEGKSFKRYIEELNNNTIKTKKMLNRYLTSFLLEYNAFSIKNNIDNLTNKLFKGILINDVNIYFGNKYYKYDLLLINNNNIIIIDYIYITNEGIYKKLKNDLINKDTQYISLDNLNDYILKSNNNKALLESLIKDNFSENINISTIIVTNKTLKNVGKCSIMDIPDFKGFLEGLETYLPNENIANYISSIRASGETYNTFIYLDKITTLANNYIYYLSRLMALNQANKNLVLEE